MIFKRKILIILSLLFLQFSFNKIASVEPDEFLEDSKLELRARDISKNIRCMVCQNQSIDDSDSPLAKDLRILIRNEILRIRWLIMYYVLRSTHEFPTNL